MDLHRNVAYAEMVRSMKEEQVLALGELTDILRDHCAVCWAYQGLLRPKHGNQGLWVECRGAGARGFVDNIGSAWRLKKLLKYPVKYRWCFKCGLPQDEDRVASHPKQEELLGNGIHCPHKDLVVNLVNFIRIEPLWWVWASTAFRLSSNLD